MLCRESHTPKPFSAGDQPPADKATLDPFSASDRLIFDKQRSRIRDPQMDALARLYELEIMRMPSREGAEDAPH